MSDDALTRLEKWLEAAPPNTRYAHYVCRTIKGGYQIDLVWLKEAIGTCMTSASAPTLSAAIHAALDRAEEAGL